MRRTGLVRTSIKLVRNRVLVAVGQRAATASRIRVCSSRFHWADIRWIWNAVTVGIGSRAAKVRRIWHWTLVELWALVIAIQDAIAIAVHLDHRGRTTTAQRIGSRSLMNVRAQILGVDHTIAVTITRRRTAVGCRVAGGGCDRP